MREFVSPTGAGRSGFRSARELISAACAAAFALIASIGLCVVPSLAPGVRMLANTVMAIGGGSNPTGMAMDQELNGYLDPASPDYGFPGHDFATIGWPALPLPAPGGFDDATDIGVANLDAAISEHFADPVNSADQVVVVGYSWSAIVVTRQIRNLDAEGSPYADNLSFLAMGSPTRPNGGIFTRFPGVWIPIIDIPFGPPNPSDTDYGFTDVSWEYDTVSDFPTYPLNLLSLLNTVVAFPLQHALYYHADLDDASENPNLTYTAADGTEYITVAPKWVPLLQPFAMIGVPDRLLGLVHPALKVLIDFGYDRSTPVGQTRAAQLLPPPSAWEQLGPNLTAAVRQGVDNFLGRSSPSTTIDVVTGKPTDPTNKPSAAAETVQTAETPADAAAVDQQGKVQVKDQEVRKDWKVRKGWKDRALRRDKKTGPGADTAERPTKGRTRVSDGAPARSWAPSSKSPRMTSGERGPRAGGLFSGHEKFGGKKAGWAAASAGASR